MKVELYLAPAAAGKTAYLLTLAREVAQGLEATPRVVVPSQLQMAAWRRRLAEAGGSIGVRLMTFQGLYAQCLNLSGDSYTQLSGAVQRQLIHAIVNELPLQHFAPLANRPGLVQVLQNLIAELKAAKVEPELLTQAVPALGEHAQPKELALIYARYQERLQGQGWADRAGLGWLAVEALSNGKLEATVNWPLLVIDGFDNLTPIQIETVQLLAQRVKRTVMTLTGSGGNTRKLAHRRFIQTQKDLEEALGVQAVPLPKQRSHHTAPLSHLERYLFQAAAPQIPAQETIDLVEAPDRDGEVRAALRWIKERLVFDHLRPGEVALLARSVPPYRPFILQRAAEFGLPVRLVDGLPLRSNPAVATIMDLLRLLLPGPQGPGMPRRLVVEAWRSPYLDWTCTAKGDERKDLQMGPQDADTLDLVARWGRVIGGRDQWLEVLQDLCQMTGEGHVGGDDTYQERGIPPGIPRGTAAKELLAKFRHFEEQLRPPPGQQTYRVLVRWLEALIGPDPQLGQRAGEADSLNVVAQVRAADEWTAERDIAALQAFKDVLRGLVWAEEALGSQAQELGRFFTHLSGAVEATTYMPPSSPGREEILVADVIQARGVPFRAVALLGLAEGEFPATQSEDPLLPDRHRHILKDNQEIKLQLSTESAEAEFFYEAVTRPRERLLITRPRLAENGAPWQASPYWEEVRRLVTKEPETLGQEGIPTPDRAASLPELIESLAVHSGNGAAEDWLRRGFPERWLAGEHAVRLLQLRRWGAAPSPYDGCLGSRTADLTLHYGSQSIWSASRLESYQTCPYLFFVNSALGLEPRLEPEVGLDARQLGSIFHRILEKLFQDNRLNDPTDLSQLLALLKDVAAAVLDKAPAREGFRESAWWDHIRAEITDDVRRSLIALDEIQGDFRPLSHEAVFGIGRQPPLVIEDGDDRLKLRGFIDRIDLAPDGRLRVIDYKTAGPSLYTKAAVTRGKYLQLPLYALAARDALNLGEPAEGFYWHVRQAKASPFTLSRFDDGPEGAMRVAVEKAWEAVRGARAGDFAPLAPSDGCPSYCPAATFCWHYRKGRR